MMCFRGSGLAERGVSGAEIEIRKQAHCTFDFIKYYVGGCEDSISLELAPKFGICETRRVVGDAWHSVALLGSPGDRGIAGVVSRLMKSPCSTRNVPAYAVTGEAAAVSPRATAAALCHPP
jgi:hypothetical protein